jgi:hypothetical protein
VRENLENIWKISGKCDKNPDKVGIPAKFVENKNKFQTKCENSFWI